MSELVDNLRFRICELEEELGKEFEDSIAEVDRLSGAVKNLNNLLIERTRERDEAINILLYIDTYMADNKLDTRHLVDSRTKARAFLYNFGKGNE